MPTWKCQKISIAHVSFLTTVPTWKGQKISIKVNECPSHYQVHLRLPRLLLLQLLFLRLHHHSYQLLCHLQVALTGSQPPYMQVTSPSPSPVDNGSPKGPSNSVALMHKGLFGVGFGVLLLVFGASERRSTPT
ncbi:hypothetical protein COP1_027818 [Malus domestica]